MGSGGVRVTSEGTGFFRKFASRSEKMLKPLAWQGEELVNLRNRKIAPGPAFYSYLLSVCVIIVTRQPIGDSHQDLPVVQEQKTHVARTIRIE